MLYEVTGDLVKDKQYKIFCHQTNCQGRMASGIAKQIAEEYPIVARRNQHYYRLYNEGYIKEMLGTILYSDTPDFRTCVNMYAQDRYGRIGRFTDYDAFRKCLNRLAEGMEDMPEDIKIGFPDHIGCGLGGGDWSVIRKMISDFAQNVRQDVYIVQFQK